MKDEENILPSVRKDRNLITKPLNFGGLEQKAKLFFKFYIILYWILMVHVKITQHNDIQENAIKHNE